MYRHVKRLLDTIISSIMLVVLMPLFALLALWIKLDSRGAVFFTQKRIGLHKNLFTIYKFRTMRTDTPKDQPTHLLSNAEMYITRSGRFLRKTSLDELPQLINIIKGDMSLVGPRPALYNQLDLAQERDKYGANDVRPGLTGWAQVNGRDELPIPTKARFDGEYVKQISLMMDCKCIYKTIVTIVSGDGISEGVHNEKD